MFKKTCQIAAASLAAVQSRRCNQDHTFAGGAYNSALVMGTSGSAMVTDGGHQFDSTHGQTRYPLVFDEN